MPRTLRKTHASFRLTARTKELVAKLAEFRRTSQADVIAALVEVEWSRIINLQFETVAKDAQK